MRVFTFSTSCGAMKPLSTARCKVLSSTGVAIRSADGAPFSAATCPKAGCPATRVADFSESPCAIRSANAACVEAVASGPCGEARTALGGTGA